MARARPGRGSRKAGTRQQLLEAAAQVIAEKGFGGASLMDIAERAQLTTGAIYSNFRSKEALLLELVSSRLDQVEEAPRSAAEVLAVARDAAALVDDSAIQDELRAQVEIYLLGLRDPAVRAELQRRESSLTESLATVLAGVGEIGVDPPLPTLTQLAELFFATVQGLQQHRLMFPEALPPEVFEWWAATILRTARQVNDAGVHDPDETGGGGA